MHTPSWIYKLLQIIIDGFIFTFLYATLCPIRLSILHFIALGIGAIHVSAVRICFNRIMLTPHPLYTNEI
jgi:hypothetical protein